MIHKKLPFSALEALLSGHLLDNPILMFSGKSQNSHQAKVSQNIQLSSSEKSTAVLTCLPDKSLTASNKQDLQQIRKAIREHSASNRNRPHSSPVTAPFCSGWAGYLSYEAGRVLQGLPASQSTTPLAEFFHYPLSIYLDFAENSCNLQNPHNLPDTVTIPFINHIQAAIQKHRKTDNPSSPQQQWQSGWSKEQYQQAFGATRNYLVAGDCYQVNLAMPFHCQADLTNHNPASLLQTFNAPFSAYLKTPAQTLFSVSPERFIRIDGDRIETKPIKGTIARGETAEADEHNRQWLANSPKNRAENLMIVDLLRNDLSRSAEPFSVKVTKLFDIESHANVHHMVSTIVATRRPDQHAVDVIFDALPGGSITGAPKRRAMEVIDELEHESRGAYCGVLGYFDDAGHADFNILIRTIAATTNGAVCWGGGGIVMDSTWEDEWQEIHSKVGRILNTPL